MLACVHCICLQHSLTLWNAHACLHATCRDAFEIIQLVSNRVQQALRNAVSNNPDAPIAMHAMSMTAALEVACAWSFGVDVGALLVRASACMIYS